MTIKDKILLDLGEIGNPKLLYQILDFVRLLRRNSEQSHSNVQQVLAFAGTLSSEDANEIKTSIDEAFNHIEGEW